METVLNLLNRSGIITEKTFAARIMPTTEYPFIGNKKGRWRFPSALSGNRYVPNNQILGRCLVASAMASAGYS